MNNLDNLNTKVTIFTAAISCVCLVFTTINTYAINSLNQARGTAGLVGDLTDDLTKDKARRDISLLALEHTLNPELHKNHDHNDKLLLARVASYLITNPQLPRVQTAQFKQTEKEDNAQISNTTYNEYEVYKGKGDIEVATRILTDIIYKSKEDECIKTIENFLGINNNQDQTTLEKRLRKQKCGRALAKAALGLKDGSSIDQNVNSQPQSLSTFAIAEDVSDQSVDAINSNQIFQSIAKATIIKKINQKQLSYKASLPNTHPPDQTKAVVLIHIVDSQDEETNLDDFREKLSKEDWFIASGTKVVKPTEKSCTEHSSVRFFNSDESSLAEELRQQVNGLLESKDSEESEGTFEVINKDKQGVRDLSEWSYAESVPDKTFELWLTKKGEKCKRIEK